MRRSITQEEQVAFGAYLKKLRVKRGFNQREAGTAIEMAAAYLGLIENGKRPPPSRDVLARIANAYDVPEQQLLEAAGYVRSAEEQKDLGFDPARIRWAFDAICRDPEVKYGVWVLGQDLSVEAQALFIELYEKASKRRLLKPNEKPDLDFVA